MNKRKITKHAAKLKDFVNLVKKPAIIITDESKNDEVSGIQVIERKDLRDMGKKELMKKARESI